MSIYVKDADGNRKKVAGIGLPGPTGKSAYQYAVEGGFTGTEDEFRALMGVRSNTNLLDNWYFVDPINQRGQTEYTGTGYTIDRWRLIGVNSKVTLESDGILIENLSSTGTDGTEFIMFLDENTIVPGQCTYSVLIQSSTWRADFSLRRTDSWTQVLFMSAIGTGLFSVTGNIEYTGINAIGVYVFPGQSVKISAVKLELGPVQTLAHQDADGNWVLNDPPPDKALELAKCQRYMVVLPGNGYPYSTTGTGYSFSTTGVKIGIPLPVEMRAQPAVTLIGSWDLIGYGTQTYFDVSGKSIGVHNRPRNMAVLSIEGFTGLTALQTYSLENENDSTSKLILDANL